MHRNRLSIVVGLLCVFAYATTAMAAPPNACTANSNQAAGTFIQSAPCGHFGILTTRYEDVGGVETAVTVKYMTHAPAGTPKAVAVLFAGGAGATGITGNAATGEVTAAGNNFLVRSAQLFAEHGYLALTLDRPSTTVGFTNLQYDNYRISESHAQDIATLVSEINGANLEVFLIGTSRGAISAVANDMLGSGVLISSPVTSGGSLYVGHPLVPVLQPASVGVPVQVIAHQQDACIVSLAAASQALYGAFVAASVPAHYEELSGGFDLTDNVTIFACDAKTFHGFLGIENKAVKETAKQMDKMLKTLHKAFPGNARPVAASASLSTPPLTPVSIDLATLASDADGDALSFALTHAASSRGASVSLTGSVATYTPNDAGIADGFVYVVSDGKGGTSHAVVTVEVGL